MVEQKQHRRREGRQLRQATGGGDLPHHAPSRIYEFDMQYHYFITNYDLTLPETHPPGCRDQIEASVKLDLATVRGRVLCKFVVADANLDSSQSSSSKKIPQVLREPRSFTCYEAF